MSMAPKYQVVFVRHGESEWNKLNLFCGWNDVNLSIEGKQQAVLISSAALKSEKLVFDLAFCSGLKRSNQTLDIILNELECTNIPKFSSWRLNERHYGALTGFNKRQMAEVYGEEQVQTWRRSFNISPPPITPNNPYYETIRRNPKFMKISDDEFPNTETLQITMERVVPFWLNTIVPEIKEGKRILIVAHGTSLRGLVKHIQGMTDQEIMKFNLPNSIPFIFEFDENMKPLKDIRFLADDNTVLNAMRKVASIGK